MINRQKLLKKGWTQEEISHAEGIILGAGEKRSEKVKSLDRVIYFGALLLMLVGNFVLSVTLIPFMLFATPVYLYPGMMFLGLVFGLLFDIIMVDIQKIKHAPVLKPGLFLFAVAFINIFIISVLSNQLATILQFDRGIHTPIFVSLLYVIGFMVPYLYSREHKFGQEQ